MAPRRRVVLVDGSWLIFRAFFAIPTSFRTRAGLPTNAVYGFALMFRKLLAAKTPEYAAIAFDAPGKTFRDERYPEYKAGRPPMDDDLRVQLEWIDRVVSAHRYPILRVPGYEADDIIGTLTRQAIEAGHEVRIISGDKDFAQLVCEQVRMVDTMRDVSYDSELVFKKWGVRPGQFIDYLALVGDKIDNIPGVPSIGQKTATKLLAEFDSLEGILAAVDQLSGRAGRALKEHRDRALLSQELATIDQRAPIGATLEDIEIHPFDVAEVDALFRELEFNSLISSDAGGDASHSVEVPVVTTRREAEEAITLSTKGPAPVALYPLFEAPPPQLGSLVGLALAVEGREPVYFPFVGQGEVLDEGLELLRALLEDPGTPKITHGFKLLWRELRRRGLALEGVVGDTGLESFLVDPNRAIPHRLEQLSREILQQSLPVDKTFVGSGKALKSYAAIDVHDAARCAGGRAAAIAAIWPRVRGELEEAGQLAQLLEHDLPLSRVLGQMELDGVLVDAANLKAMGLEFRRRLEAAKEKITAEAGRDFNINSTKQLSAVLFEEMGLPVIKRTKTGYSTAVGVLEKLAVDHPIARYLLDTRKLAKLINTYTDVLQRSVNPETGRVHTTFQQTTGVTGRLITTDPDIQRTPTRTAEGKRIREAFIAPPGHTLICADWSQIELRVLAHMSEDANLVEAFTHGLDIHRRTAAELFGCPEDQVDSIQRGVGKTVNFATIYGQGATALSQQLKIPRREAKAYIERYFEIYSGVRSWLDRTMATARETGAVTTLLGRRRIIPELTSRSFMERQAGERIAANTPIQGSAADICKLVMLDLSRTLSARALKTRMLLQIHDELIFEAPNDELEQAVALVRTAMENAYPLRVPLVVDIGVGASWAAAKS